MRKVFLFFIFACYVFADVNFVRGEASIIKLEQNDKVSVKRATYTIYKINGQRLLIIPIHYKAKAKSVNLCINDKCQDIKINDGKYQKSDVKEQITVDNSKVKPNKAMQERIAKEYQIANQTYAVKTQKYYAKSEFIKPLDSLITSPFGSARVFNGVLMSYHSGTDFKAAINTPIKSANAGKVVIADDRYYAGKSVIIDHGYGVFSQYYHLNEILVKKGDIVKKLQLIGKSGATGRVSGPHLHLGIAINGVSVNPLKFINDFNHYAGFDK